MMEQYARGRTGLIDVQVFAEDRSTFDNLPEWLDTRKIVDAAIAEYDRQRAEAVGELPRRATRHLF